jgi:hypothetical protein
MSDPVPPAIEPDAPDATLPPSLRLLKWLVILLTLTMIGGVITVVGLLVTRMPQAFRAVGPEVPANLELPAGAEALAVTFGDGWIAVVTSENHILIFGKDGTLRQDVELSLPAGP